ncbi:unnamed protein product, partial [Rotaria magnacalcarata]
MGNHIDIRDDAVSEE